MLVGSCHGLSSSSLSSPSSSWCLSSSRGSWRHTVTHTSPRRRQARGARHTRLASSSNGVDDENNNNANDAWGGANDSSSSPPYEDSWSQAADKWNQKEIDYLQKEDRVQQLRDLGLTEEQLSTYISEEDEDESEAESEGSGGTSASAFGSAPGSGDTTLPLKQDDLGFQVTPDEFQSLTASGDFAFGQMVQMDQNLGEVDSHTLVETDEEGEPLYERFVYVDEHSCIGCTNCACIAQSTFFMEEEHGRARVFQQFGDEDDSIDEAIDTCPVNCIHYVPWAELVALEKDRRGQVINNKARLVNQQESQGGAISHLVGGAVRSSASQALSGNAGMRCNSCPSNKCPNCPMYGIGNDQDYRQKAKEKKRKRQELAAKLIGPSDTDAMSADL